MDDHASGSGQCATRWWYVVSCLTIGTFALHIGLSARPFDREALTSNGVGTSSVGFYSANTGVGRGYYAELARSLSSGHTYLDLPYDPKLLSHPNPYGRDAFERGLVMQDASFYRGRYYLYFGPAPALLIYLPFERAFGAYPSDALVMAALALAYATVVAALLRHSLSERKWLALALFCLLVANPVILRSIETLPEVHGVSRLFAGVCILASCWMLLRLHEAVCEPGIPEIRPIVVMLSSISVLLSLAVATRATALPDVLGYSAVVGLLLWRSRSKLRLRAVTLGLIYSAPIALTGALLALYNHARFDDPLESGIRYQTHGIDLVHGVSLLRPPGDAWQFLVALAHRFYEYFLLLPRYASGGMDVRYDVVNPVVSGAYSEGLVGVLAWAPIVLLVPVMVVRAFANSLPHQGRWFDRAFFLTALSLFLINFTLIAIIPTAAFHYALEFMPRLVAVVVGAMLAAGDRMHGPVGRFMKVSLVVSTVVLSLGGMARGDLL